ncbi:MAG: hypothetical protein R3C31_10405 [Hyphomonadaceae bacterium]
MRDTLERLIALPIVTEEGLRLTLGEVARVEIADGPSMIRSENGRLSAFVYVDGAGAIWLRSWAIPRRWAAALLAGVSVAYSGQFEYPNAPPSGLAIVGPHTLAISFFCSTPPSAASTEAGDRDGEFAVRALTGGICRLLVGLRFLVAVVSFHCPLWALPPSSASSC